MFTPIGQETARAWLADVPQDKVFLCHDGSSIRSLDELATSLRSMSEGSFSHHANKANNDFANWVRDVIGDMTLANQLQKATTNSTAARKVETRLEFLKAKL